MSSGDRTGTRVVTITHTRGGDDLAAVKDLWREYIAWVDSFVSDRDTAPTFHALDEEMAGLPGLYDEPNGRLLLARLDDAVAGTVAMKPHSTATCELKRLYVRPGFRGHDLGRLLVARVMADARASGYRRMMLDSHISMTRAHALYEAAGFRRVPAPADFPAELVPIAVFMECDLAG
jgi:GNAT superfamily N-acetyltransferase